MDPRYTTIACLGVLIIVFFYKATVTRNKMYAFYIAGIVLIAGLSLILLLSEIQKTDRLTEELEKKFPKLEKVDNVYRIVKDGN